jgi:uncharacterized phage protein (predicted DNA packaging)
MVTLDEMKAHLRIVGNEEDELLTLYGHAAAEYVREYTRSPWDYGVPFSVKAAVLLLVGDFYENREAQGPALHENKTVERLLWPHRAF